MAEVTDFNAPPGKGVQGTVDGRRAYLGNAKFLRGKGIDPQVLENQAEDLRGRVQPLSCWRLTDK